MLSFPIVEMLLHVTSVMVDKRAAHLKLCDTQSTCPGMGLHASQAGAILWTSPSHRGPWVTSTIETSEILGQAIWSEWWLSGKGNASRIGYWSMSAVVVWQTAGRWTVTWIPQTVTQPNAISPLYELKSSQAMPSKRLQWSVISDINALY